ncbi:MAG: CRTAC1 family protein [Myxococcota bacterium]
MAESWRDGTAQARAGSHRALFLTDFGIMGVGFCLPPVLSAHHASTSLRGRRVAESGPRLSGIMRIAAAFTTLLLGMGCVEGSGSLDDGQDRGPPSDACAGAADGDFCDDGDDCTENDVCEDGVCAGTALACPGDRDACLVGACQDGRCMQVAAEDEAPCDDGNACTRTDVCVGGLCHGRDALHCSSGATCRTGACNPSTGECEGETAPDGAPCSNVCIEEGICRAGECVGAMISCPAPSSCFEATCDTTLGCVETPLPDGSACDDGDLCTLQTECLGGVCASSNDVRCIVLPCMLSNQCNPATGACESEFAPEGSPCDDGNQCTTGESCAFNDCGNGEKVPFSEARCADGVCFTEVAAQVGVSFGGSGPPLSNGIGAAGTFGDLDGDGDLDIILASETEGPEYYRNDGNGSFTDRTSFAGFEPVADASGIIQGLAMGDYDNDGDLDLYFSTTAANFLLRNDGSAGFSNATAAAGVDYAVWTTGATFGDYDGDGWLDLYVSGYIGPGGRFPNHNGLENRLFHNEGDGTFTDVTERLGVGGSGSTPGATSVTAITDIDGDGDLDLMDCNDLGQFVVPNRTYENDGGANFTEVSTMIGLGAQLYCRGIGIGDYDRDGDLDYYFTSIGRNELLQDQGVGGFVDVSVQLGAALEQDSCSPQLFAAGWGAVFEDFDNDGWQDLFVANGFTPTVASAANALESENKLLLNQLGVDSGLPFLDVSRSARVAADARSRSVAAADYDRDGDVDLLVTNLQDGVELLRNDLSNQNSWLSVDLDGRVSNRDGVGAKIIAETPDGPILRELGSAPSFLGPAAPEVHFGLGEIEAVDVVVEWPSGLVQRWVEVDQGRLVRILESRISFDGLTAPSSVVAGEEMAVTVDITERSNQSGRARVVVELQEADGTTNTRDIQVRDLAALASESVSFSVSIPGTAMGPMRLFIEVEDFGAFDQWIHPFSVVP